MGAAASQGGSPPDIDVGDVVKAKIDDLFFEGVVVSIDDERMLIDFGNNDVRRVPSNECVKTLTWHSLEIGDTVQVRELRGRNSYVASVTRVDVDDNGKLAYVVDYGGDTDDTEDNVDPARVRKLASERSTPLKMLHKAVNVVAAANFIRKVAASKFSPKAFDLKIGDVVRVRHGVEGIVEQIEDDDKCLVYFENEKKSAWLGRNEIMEKLHMWSHIEVGDTVKAKAQGESLWYDATILQVHDGPLYTIRWHGFDDDDRVCSSADDNHTDDDGGNQCETDVHPSRIRKIQSKRHQLLRERWHSTKRLTAPLAAFREASVSD